MSNRSLQPEVRNPLCVLPAAQQMRSLPPESQLALRSLLLDLSRDARQRADESWRRHKAPMAMYWKAVAVYARHAATLLKAQP